MKKKLLTITLALAFCLAGSAEPVLQFQTTHGGALHDSAKMILPTADGNFIYAGTTSSAGQGDSDILLSKMTRNGTLLWTKTFGGPNREGGGFMVATPDGNYVIQGWTESFGAGGADNYLLKVDPDGNVIWEKTIGTPDLNRAQGNLVVTSDGGLLMTGQSLGFGVLNDYYTVKTDLDGNVLWVHTYDSGSYDAAKGVIETADGDYLINGLTFGGGKNETLVKVDANGNQIFVKTFAPGGQNQGHMVNSSDGNYLILGRSFTDQVFLRKIDADGNVLFFQEYGGPGSEWGYQVVEMAEGGFLIAGETTSFGAGGSDAYLIRTDDQGNELWTQTYGGVSEDWITSLTVINENEYIAVGRTQSFGNANGFNDVYVLGLTEIEGNSSLHGRVYVDQDANGVFDAGIDLPLANRLVKALGAGGPFHTLSGDDGTYEFRLDPGLYEVSKDEADGWLVRTGVSNPTVVNVELGLNGPVDFPTGPNHANDCMACIEMTTAPYLPCPNGKGLLISPCPGYPFRYCITVENKGGPAFPAQQATISVTLPPGMTYVATVSGNWTFQQVTAGGVVTWASTRGITGTRVSTLCFEVSVNALGTNPQLTSNSVIPFSLDYTCRGDNQTALNDTFTNGDNCACDPNDLIVMPPGCGSEGAVSNDVTLNYMVRFFNEGTGPAHYIVIEDFLDPDLDFSTIRLVASSHTVPGMQLTPDDKLVFSFRGIELQPNEHGYVQFSANMKPGLAEGTQVKNQADIFFDRMPPVRTNEVLNTVRDQPEPVAHFTYQHSATDPGYVYDFEYSGVAHDDYSYSWDFGPGAVPATSSDRDPQGVVFPSPGPHPVTLTVDRFGCVATFAVQLTAETYIRGKKVLICHNGRELWVSINALPAHLRHGDTVGPCRTGSKRK